MREMELEEPVSPGMIPFKQKRQGTDLNQPEEESKFD